VNRWRAGVGLPPQPFFGSFERMQHERTPIINGFSEQVIPRPPDWGAHIHMTGWWMPEDLEPEAQAPGWTPPADLQRFLAGKPVLGICLGSQFMAKALGATIRPGRALEIGMTPIYLTNEGKQDPVFGSFPEAFSVFEWHGEIFDLPKDCLPLAGSDIAPLQAFRYGSRAYGLLFHLEMEPAGIDALCRECATDLTKTRLTAQQVKTTALPQLPALHRMADHLIGHLLSPRH
jgi:GMP synthase-like glutamine amidotransferase